MALGLLCTGLAEVREGSPKSVVRTFHLALSHQEQSELILAIRLQCAVVFERVESKRPVRVLDCFADVAALLVCDSKAVVCPAQPGKVPHRAGGPEGFLIKSNRLVKRMVLDVNRGDVLEDPRLGSRKARIRGPTQLERPFGH